MKQTKAQKIFCIFNAIFLGIVALICLLPMLISMLVIVAGPCIQNQDRYGFPIVYCMPLALACMSHAMHKQTEAAGKAL